uniref:NB-ARC domain-containing protein n=1 Tax=Quercus lobata TaxID=97700 RepID=A0A7N2M9I7_QUELO
MKSNDVRMVGIHSLGGVGKTTIAKAIYNRITNCFELSCFLEDVREKSGTNDDMIKLQEMLLSKISLGTYVKVDSVPKGIIMIKERLCRTRLLLILDNVDESEVIVNLLGECNWFALGSRVIITTRDGQGSSKIRGIMCYSPQLITMPVEAKAFEKMKYLKFLMVRNVRICEELKYLPNGLTLLQWPKFPFSLPSKYYPQQLVALEMPRSLIRLETTSKLVHESVGFLDKLRIWELQGCGKLKILPNNLRLKSLKEFRLIDCLRLDKFPNIDPEMKCLRELNLRGTDNIYKLQLLIGLYTPTAKLRQTCNYLDGFSSYGFLTLDSMSFRGNKNIIELDFLMKPEYFPILKYLDLSKTNIVGIPESLSRFTTLQSLDIRNCKHLREIPRLPQSVQVVDVGNCYSLNPQSSSRLLNQIGEFLGIFPNKGCKGTRSRISIDPQTSSTEILDEIRRSLLPNWRSKPEDDKFIIRLPRTEIPTWLKLNHESDGNVISFWVGRTFPNIFDVCFAFGPLKYSWTSSCDNRLNKSSPSEPNYVEVTCRMEDWVKNHPRRWGVHVECICRSQQSDVFLLPSPSATHSCGSSSIPLLLTSSCGTVMDQHASIMEEILDIGQEETIDHPMPNVPKNTTCPTLDGFEFRLWKQSFRPTQIPTAMLKSREFEEIDPRSFNNGEEDSGHSMAHTFINDCSNSKLHPPSK